MATAREDTQPYGGGAGGKILNRPFRRSTHETPYDRPPTALRNPTGGWISKLVDPAQRLIASGASRMFSTVFRRRLPSPQPLLATESCREASNAQQDAVTTREGGSHQNRGPSNSDNRDGLTELEQILTQKTFSSSEIERLTALLHSKTADISNENHDKRLDVIALRSVASADKQRHPGAPAHENGIESHHISSPLVTSSVLEEDTASPAELAKAYMGSRPSKVSPSMLGSRSRLFRESSTVLNSDSLRSKLPITPLLPMSSGNLKAPENGVTTPRSRGRSAIYSMARIPYSKMHSTSAFKVRSNADVNGGSSSSQSVLEQSSPSGSKQGALKRRSSVLDNDIGSFGPIRKIRQKPNLTSRGLGSPTSGTPLSISGTRLVPHNAQNLSFSMLKPVSFGEVKHDFMKVSTEDGVPSSSFSSVPSKSSEMASKILQQLDKLVSPKEKLSVPKHLTLRDKSPSKLYPSMLHGQALKSLEHVDSSKFFGNVLDKKNSDDSLDKLLTKAGDITSQKQNKAKENGPLKLGDTSEKSTAEVNNVDSVVMNKDAITSVRTAVHVASSSVSYPQSKQGFRMSAHEDFLDLDDEGYSNGSPSDMSADIGEKVETFLVERKNDVPEPFPLEKPSALAQVKPVVSSAMNQKTDLGTSDGCIPVDKGGNFIPSTSLPNMMIQSTVVTSQSSLLTTTSLPTMVTSQLPLPTLAASQSLTREDATKAKESNVAPPIFLFGDKVPSIKDSAVSKESNFALGDKVASTIDSNSASPLFNFGSKVVDLGDKVASTIDSNSASSLFNFGSKVVDLGDKVASTIDTNSASPLFNFGSKVVDKAPQLHLPSASSSPSVATESTGIKFGAFLESKPETKSCFLTAAAGVNDSQSKVLEPYNTDDKNNLNAAGSSTASEALLAPAVTASTPTSIFSFIQPSNNSGLSNGSFASTFKASAVSNYLAPQNVSSGSIFTSSGNNTFATSSTMVSSNSGSISMSTPATPSFPAASMFKFGSSASTAGASISATSDEIKTKQDSSAGNLTSRPSAGTFAPVASTGSSPFGFSATTTSTFENQSKVSTSLGAGSGSMLGAHASPVGTGVATFTQGTPIQFGSSTSSPSFVVAGSTTLSSGSSLFGSTSASNLFGSGAITGTGSASSSEANAVSSSNGSTPSLSNWPPAKSPIFGSTFNSTSPSTGFSFGGSSTSSTTAFSFGSSSTASASNSAPVFGLSNSASSNSIYSFTSSSTSAPTQNVFGNTSPAFSFGSASAGNNDQMSMEDSMAEDTVQASAPAVPFFGQQQPVLPNPTTVHTAASTVPAFGQQQPLSPSPTSFAFGSIGSSVGSPFQFGSQPNLAMQQNHPPFQASGSLGFTEGSNFSLGSGGSGVDKSNRKYVKPVRNKHRKK